MRFLTVVFIFLFASVVVNSTAMGQGTWTQLTNQSPLAGCGAMILLTDGTVLVFSGSGTTGAKSGWAKLTPDSSGNYINGTFTTIAPMSLERLYFGSNVLPSGKLFVMGGEYSGPSGDANFTNTGEIYDPVSNSWSPVAQFPQPYFGDDPTVLLPNGKILCGYIGDGGLNGATDGLTYLYNPATNTWAQTGRKLLNDQSDEETWSLLPDGSVLSYNVFASPATGTGSAQRYVPSTGTWVATGSVPVPLTNLDTLGAELGPQMLLPDGRVILIGANNNTVLYNPSTNTWAKGPTLPTNMGSDDAPGAMLPNGKFLFLADFSQPNLFTPPTKAFLFDPVGNTITNVTPSGTLGSILASQSAFQFCMLMLPNGHMLLSTGQRTLWDLAPTGSPSASWAPTITSITHTASTTYRIAGTQLTGISEGSSYGDDLENSTNYPIVRAVDSKGVVRYLKTTNWTPGVATGSLQTTVDVTFPASVPSGTYQVSVIANGIASSVKSYYFGAVASNVTAQLSGHTLTVTGDANPNSVTIRLSGTTLTVEGANGTQINGTTSYAVNSFSGTLALNVVMDDGDDSLALIGIPSKDQNSTIRLGPGNDKIAFTLCDMGVVDLYGGLGTNVLVKTSSTFVMLNTKNGF